MTPEPDSEPVFNRSSPNAEQAAAAQSRLDQASAESAFAPKRRFPRFLVDIPVKVVVSTQGPTKVISGEGQGTDLSLGGFAINVDLDLTVGDQIAVEFKLPFSDQSISFRCFIRNRQGASYGVEFITENDDDYQKTAQLNSALLAMNT